MVDIATNENARTVRELFSWNIKIVCPVFNLLKREPPLVWVPHSPQDLSKAYPSVGHRFLNSLKLETQIHIKKQEFSKLKRLNFFELACGMSNYQYLHALLLSMNAQFFYRF